jgi:hypothetical protein
MIICKKKKIIIGTYGDNKVSNKLIRGTCNFPIETINYRWKYGYNELYLNVILRLIAYLIFSTTV